MSLKAAKPNLETVKLELDATKLDLEAAKPELETARLNLEAVRLELETAKLRDIDDQIAICFIVAPRAGQVTYVNKFSQGRSGSSAEFVG